MHKFIYGQDQEVADYVAQRIPGLGRGFGQNIKTIGIVDRQGNPIAGVVYHHWNPECGTIAMSAAAERAGWLTRPVLTRIFNYPFIECECQLVTMMVPVENERLLRQLAVGGFTFFKILRLYGRNSDGVVATLSDDDWFSCRFNRREAA